MQTNDDILSRSRECAVISKGWMIAMCCLVLAHVCVLIGYLYIPTVGVAAARGDVSSLKRLEALGVDVSHYVNPYLDWQSSLHIAVSFCNASTVKYLLDRGADVNRVDVFGQTPLHKAAAVGCLESMQALIAAGADVNALSRFNMTPLCIAVRNEHIPCITLLLTHKADISLGSTSVTVEESGNQEIITLLKSAFR